jgi:hypothetical protein
MRMSAIRKVTMNLPAKLLADAQAATGKNATETVKIALQEFHQRWVQNELRKLRGKVKFSMTYQEMKGDDYCGSKLK